MNSNKDTLQWMAILNITPDSFSDGGELSHVSTIRHRVQEAVEAGVQWLDVGAESTRPGAPLVSEEEELQRLEEVWPVLLELTQYYPNLHISLDTRKPKVANRVLGWGGVACINDVSGGRYENGAMFDVVAHWQCDYVLMHSRGTPTDMDGMALYTNIVEDITQELNAVLQKAVERGVEREKIIVDPGFGFAKTEADGLKLLKGLAQFKEAMGGLRLLLGLSRKRITSPPWPPWPLEAKRREAPSAALHLWALTQLPYGTVNIIRAHDVPQQAAAYERWMALQYL
jgi:dihydropteroate synthase